MRLATTACGYSGRPTCPCTLYRTSQAMPPPSPRRRRSCIGWRKKLRGPSGSAPTPSPGTGSPMRRWRRGKTGHRANNSSAFHPSGSQPTLERTSARSGARRERRGDRFGPLTLPCVNNSPSIRSWPPSPARGSSSFSSSIAAVHGLRPRNGSDVKRGGRLRDHRGVHPRVGAIDVVPFVPLCGATMRDAIAALEASPGLRIGLFPDKIDQEVADLDPNLPPAEVARLVDRVLVRVLAAEDRAEARYTVPNPLGDGLGDRRVRAPGALSKARTRPARTARLRLRGSGTGER